MNTAAVFLVVAALAAFGGSLVLWFGHRVRQPPPADFNEQLRALAPRQSGRTTEQPSGIVPLEPRRDQER